MIAVGEYDVDVTGNEAPPAEERTSLAADNIESIRRYMHDAGMPLDILCMSTHEVEARARGGDVVFCVSTQVTCGSVRHPMAWELCELCFSAWHDRLGAGSESIKSIVSFGMHPYDFGFLVDRRLLEASCLPLAARRAMLRGLANADLRNTLLGDTDQYDRILLQGYPQDFGGDFSRASTLHAWLSLALHKMALQSDARGCDVFASARREDIALCVAALTPQLRHLGFSRVQVFHAESDLNQDISLTENPLAGRSLRIFTHRHSDADLQILEANSELPLASGDNTIMDALCTGPLPLFQMNGEKVELFADLQAALHDPALEGRLSDAQQEHLWTYFETMWALQDFLNGAGLSDDSDRTAERRAMDECASPERTRIIQTLAELSVRPDVIAGYAIFRDHLIATYGLSVDGPGPLANWIQRQVVCAASSALRDTFNAAVRAVPTGDPDAPNLSLTWLAKEIPPVV